MSNTVSRARVWALLGLMAYAPLAASQTMEIVTGAGRYVDVPGTTVPVAPVILGNQYHLTNSGPTGNQFYRLIFP